MKTRPAAMSVLAALYSVLTIGCAPSAQVTVELRRDEKGVLLNVGLPKENRLLQITVRDANLQTLWDVETRYCELRTFVYGVLDASSSCTCVQLFPPTGMPPKLVTGTTVIVEIGYSYDDPIPSAGTFRTKAVVP